MTSADRAAACSRVQRRSGIKLVYAVPNPGMVAKIFSTTCFGLLIAAMSALNDEFRRLLIDMANGGLKDQVASFTNQTLKFGNSMLDAVGSHGGDQNWLLFTALGGAIVLVVWFLRW